MGTVPTLSEYRASQHYGVAMARANMSPPQNLESVVAMQLEALRVRRDADAANVRDAHIFVNPAVDRVVREQHCGTLSPNVETHRGASARDAARCNYATPPP